MTKSLVATLAAIAATLTLNAETLSAPTAVHTQPDANSVVVKVLAPGTAPAPAMSALVTTPAGWMAVVITGPFEAYVQNNDIDKALHVKLGSSIHLEPKSSSGVLTTMGAGDQASITGLHGKWTQISLEKTTTGFIQTKNLLAPKTAAEPVLRDVSAQAAPPRPAQTTPVYPNATRPVAPANYGTPGANILPRFFQGTLASTRRPFTLRRPFDWQLNDDAGVRYAYLDLEKLFLTDPITHYADREVVVFGTPVGSEDGKNIIIKVESLRLK